MRCTSDPSPVIVLVAKRVTVPASTSSITSDAGPLRSVLSSTSLAPVVSPGSTGVCNWIDRTVVVVVGAGVNSVVGTVVVVLSGEGLAERCWARVEVGGVELDGTSVAGVLVAPATFDVSRADRAAAMASAAITPPITANDRRRLVLGIKTTSVPASAATLPDSISSSGTSTGLPQELQNAPEPNCCVPHEKQDRRRTMS